jgi:hypothetical protein
VDLRGVQRCALSRNTAVTSARENYRVRPSIPLLFVAILAAGCSTDRVDSRPPEGNQARDCEVGPPGFRRCDFPTSAEDGGLPARSSIERLRDDGTWQEIAGHVGTHVPVPGGWVGHWASLALSPDRETILALWSAECGVPTAYFVLVEGGGVRPVTGERDRSKAPISSPIGWTRDGRARVRESRPRPGRGMVDRSRFA